VSGGVEIPQKALTVANDLVQTAVIWWFMPSEPEVKPAEKVQKKDK
jgi:hypothetical protein